MKKYLLMVSSVALVLNASALMAGSITDNYAKGDVLSAAKLDSIKTAVNDNNNASRFYGDGSAGPLTIGSDTDWSSTFPAGDNFNFTDVVIDAGVTLKVPAGTTIRCSGTFTNNGVIEVLDTDNRGTFFTVAGKGDARRVAGSGQSAPAGVTSFLGGGFGGVGIPKSVAASSFNHFTIGGGAGGDVTAVSGVSSGGGLIKVYAKGAITTTDNIQANGNDAAGTGGGGGGIIILASSTSIDNTGAINAKGGKGIKTGGAGAPGGGGGGIIILVSPIINTSTSTLFVNGGTGGASGGTVNTANVHRAGSGGGASGGNGGVGGHINSPNFIQSAGNGGNGYALQILANPASMMQ